MQVLRPHKYEVWYSSIVDNLLLTGSDDCSFMAHDLRSLGSKVFSQSKQHTAGVTFIDKHPYLSKCIISGSYD